MAARRPYALLPPAAAPSTGLVERARAFLTRSFAGRLLLLALALRGIEALARGVGLAYPDLLSVAVSSVLYVFAAFVLAGPLGLGLALLPRPVYDFYERAPELWGLSHLADQQIAGVTMAAEQAVVLFAALVVCVRRFFREEGSADSYRVLTVRRS